MIFTNLIAGVSGLDKSAINTANLFAEADYDTHILNCVGKEGGFASIKPKFPLSPRVNLHSLQAMAASRGRFLLEKQNLAYTVQQERLKASFTEHDLRVICELNQFLNEEDLVIFTHPLQADLFSKAINGRKRKVKSVLQIHGNYVEEHHNRDLLLSGESCIDDLQIVSESMRQDLLSITSIESNFIHYIPNVHYPIKIKREKSNKFNVAVIGSLQDRKNQIDAVRSILQIDNQDIVLNLWGNHESDYGSYLKLYVKNLGVEDRIRFRGIGTEAEIYNKTDLVLITSKHEGFGYTMIEAATHGIPTIAYDYKYGADEFIVDGVNGYLVPMGQVDTLSSKIMELESNRNQLKVMGEKAKNAFNEKFSPNMILAQYTKLIPRGTKNKAEDLYDLFSRDNILPVKSDAIHLKNKKIFGIHYADKVSFAFSEKVNASFWTFRNAKKLRKVSYKRDENGFYKAIVWNIPRNPWTQPKKYTFAAEDNQGNISYIFNTNKKSKFEILSEYSRGRLTEDYAVNYKDWPVSMERAGTSIKMSSFEPVKRVQDDDGTNISWVPNTLNKKGIVTPCVCVVGEFDAVNIQYSSGRNFRVCPPNLSYSEIFDRIIDLEKKLDLLNYEIGGIYPWELIRATVLEQIMMGLGLWSTHFAPEKKVSKLYLGKKIISEAPKAERLIFEFPRKGDIDRKTAHIRSDDDVVVEYPQDYGYSIGSYLPGNIYPIDEFWEKTKELKLSHSQRYKSDVLGPAFRDEFGLDLDFKKIVESRLLKFKKEYEFWSRIFDGQKFGEIIIPSAYWSAGICCAGKNGGAMISDLQYALITPLHPTNSFSGKVKYTPDKIYVWSEYWKKYAKKYDNKEVVKRSMNFDVDRLDNFDFCVVSQPRVKKRIERFLLKLSNARKEMKIVYCLHPDEGFVDDKVVVDGVTLENVTGVKGNTLAYMAASKVVIGGYSTSLYEAAYLGKPVYVVKVPGWEVVSHAIDQGIFCVAESPEDLIAFKQKSITREIF
ncbi:glycosyltransferase [Roseibium aggregatum]|uniref:glycosyltransferase n=1 Tax=Roseibium aggregatum TaxID=187304 RepID=UPI001E64A942|nr:glycosyltransferase [Roseibium aggregatum]